MEPHRPKGASLFDLDCTKRKRTEDDGPARELIIRLRPDVQQAVAARDAAIAASIASRPAPVKRPVGRPKVQHHWACKPPQERGMCGQSCNSGGVGGRIRCACICTSQICSSSSSSRSSRSCRSRQCGLSQNSSQTLMKTSTE